MQKIVKGSFFLLSSICLFLFAFWAYQSYTSSQPELEPMPEQVVQDPKAALIDSYLQTMTLEEKVGQLFLARVPASHQLEAIQTYHVGGYILFSRDIEGRTLDEVREQNQDYQGVSKVPLLIAADEEGGTVTRVSQLLEEPFPSPMELYSTGGMEAVLAQTDQKINLLSDLGIQAGFFPVSDLALDPNSFIYDRTIGQNAEVTATYVGQMVGRLKERRFLSTLKHFPGYGDNADSHLDLVYDQRPLDVFQQYDFLPFRAGIAAGADSVMVSHNIVTAMDHVPASLSPVVNQILRSDLGFKGVVMTDDFDMEGLAQFANQESAALQTIQAGTDMILSSSYSSQIPYLIEQIEAGAVSIERINQSVRRILEMKYHLGLLDQMVSE